ncbi:NAD(P)/FAD-dependent oxidoreductase [Alkalicoccus urumqiensis]|uniref:FAD-dependent oxidoreductase n=1 Tax=Alkalicoccus urumqiensis TaxID=1548213 RepID=A0A2P6MKW3_ALKUR|nr:FAD-dependent oxidoreductase [Alkalicoccus urumqiensis]PRO66904.1 FAD-dependent oxidoreductase [Alkalicoccus urumqiensis]
MEHVVVIGGGITGASAAFHAAEAGAEVTLIDESHPGQATAAGAGIISPWLSQRRNKAWYALARGGAAYYPELIQALEEYGETDTGYYRSGAIHLHDIEERLQHKYSHALKRRETAPEMGAVELLSENETNSLFPQLRPGYRSVWVEGGGRVDGRKVRNALIRAAAKKGVTVIYGRAELVHQGNDVSVKVDGSTLHPDKIIAAAGAWSSGLLAPLGVKSAIKPQKGQILHLKIKEENHSWPVVMPHNEYYLLHFGKGHVVFGATREDNSGYDTRRTAEGHREILSAALELAPGLKDAEVVETRVGLRPSAPNFMPVFGSLPDYPQIFMADGLGASGLTSGPFVGRQTAHLALGQKTELETEQYDVSQVLED